MEVGSECLEVVHTKVIKVANFTQLVSTATVLKPTPYFHMTLLAHRRWGEKRGEKRNAW